MGKKRHVKIFFRKYGTRKKLVSETPRGVVGNPIIHEPLYPAIPYTTAEHNCPPKQDTPLRDHYTPLRDHYTPLRDHYTPLRDQYTPLRDHTKYCHDTSTRSSFCTIRDPIILATSTVTKWVAIRLKKCMLCVHKTKINTNHAQRYEVIGSLFHKTHVKIDQNDHVW